MPSPAEKDEAIDLIWKQTNSECANFIYSICVIGFIVFIILI